MAPKATAKSARAAVKNERLLHSPLYMFECGKVLKKGLEFQVEGECGAWFRFICMSRNADSGLEWIEAFGGRRGHARLRSFSVERVKRDSRGKLKIRKTELKEED